jgi:lipase
MARSPLFVTTFNEGPETLLALHGVEAHGLRYLRLAALLPEVRVIAPDMRGHGRSPKDGPWTVAQHVRDLLPLLEYADRAMTLVGHSFGGLVAWELARAAPQRVARLALVDPAIGVSAEVADEGRVAAAADLRWPTAAAAFEAALEGRSPAAAWSIALDVAVAMELDEEGMLRDVVAAQAVTAAWDEMERPLSDSAYGGPTLLIEAAAENGRYVSAALVAALRRRLAGRLQHVKVNAPHTLPADHPDLLARLVGEFLQAQR